MTWKTITTQLSNPDRADVLLSVAGRLAERFEAHLIGLDATPSFTFAAPMVMPVDVDAIVAAEQARGERLKTIFETTAANRAFVAEWREVRPETSDLAAAVLDYARASDLLVVSQSDPNWELSGLFDFPSAWCSKAGVRCSSSLTQVPTAR